MGPDCCTSNCLPTGTCGPPCAGYGKGCTASDQCCSQLGCLGGATGSPATCTFQCKDSWAGLDACTADSECCSGYHCRAGYCQAGTCGALRSYCLSDADCCAGTTPRLHCDAWNECACGEFGDACADAADCCTGLECRSGQCHPPAASIADRDRCLDASDCIDGSCRFGTCCSGQGGACGATSLCCGSSGPSLACLAVTGTCDLQRDVGGACAAPGDCGTAHCQALPGTACTVDGDCYMGSCVAGACQGGLSAPCGSGEPCHAPLVCSANGICLEPPGGACGSSFDCNGSDSYDTSVSCLEGTCCLQPGFASTTCGVTAGTNGAECCSRTCDAGSGTCSCSGPLAPCSDSRRCCNPMSSCIIDDPLSPYGKLCCAPVKGACRTASDCCDNAGQTYRAGQIDCGTTGVAAGACCVMSGKACSAGEVCCSGQTCPSTGKSPTCP